MNQIWVLSEISEHKFAAKYHSEEERIKKRQIVVFFSYDKG